MQYHVPVYRFLQEKLGIPVTVIYGSDFSIAGYRDREFGETFSWDTDLLSGYTSIFLSKTSDGGFSCLEKVSAIGLTRLLRGMRPKAILIPGYNSRFYQSVLWEVMKIKQSILFRAETTDHAVRRNLIWSWLRDKILQSIYRRCAGLLYIGLRSKAHFERLGFSGDRLIFSPYGVDESSFQSDEKARSWLRTFKREALQIREDQYVILFSGKMIHRKGADLLVMALKKLENEIRNRIVVVFLGNGDMKDELGRLASAAPSLEARFVGFQNQSALSAYYHAADLLVLPSRNSETWGLVVNEALLHGVPCVVSDQVGCAPDLIELGETGEIFKSESVPDLTHALTRCLALSGRPEVRQKCRNKVSGYSIERTAEGIATAYRLQEDR